MPVPAPSVHRAQGFVVNLSPAAFRKWARQYYECAVPLLPQTEFSPVPFFLLCRAIELQLKAQHLEAKRQSEVKAEFGHHLVKAYSALPAYFQVLEVGEFQVLAAADTIYRSKGFEYWGPEHALRGYSQFPDLVVLNKLTRRLLEYRPEA